MAFIIIATTAILTPNADLRFTQQSKDNSYSTYQPTLGLQILQQVPTNLASLL